MKQERKFRVVIPKPVEKDFGKLQERTIKRVYRALKKLANDPFPGAGKAVKKLQMEELTYRLRVGSYRVIYRVEGLDVVVLAIVSRGDLKRELKKLM